MASVCEPEWKTLATAAEAYAAYTGAYPTDQFVLVAEGLVLRTIDDFEYSTVGDGYVLTGVGQCFGFDPNIPSGDADPEPASDVSGCDADLKTLQTAWEAFNAQYGTAPDSQGDLVDAGFLREPSSHFDLIGSEFVPVPGACD